MTTAPVEILEKVLPPWISKGILEQGYYHLGGHVARAVDTIEHTPAELVHAWGLAYDGSPFQATPDHVDVLRFRSHPLMSFTIPAPSADRPWPTYPLGFLVGPTMAPVWLLERTRVPPGAELWRRTTNGEDRMLASFEGPALGWRGSRGYYPPVHFVGTRAKWNGLDLAAELTGDGTTVELVSVGSPNDEGWTEVRPQVWRREVPRTEVSQLFELVLTCTYDRLPCRILQHTPEHSRLLLLTDDPDAAAKVGAEEADIGVFEITVATNRLTDVAGTTRELAAVP